MCASFVRRSTSSNPIPKFGLGTWKIPKVKCQKVVYEALKSGIRHLDCACDYGNEPEVGKAIKQALEEGFLTREELFVTSKLWNTYHAREHVEPAARKSLEDLGLEYFDLYLIHFPISLKFVEFEERYPPEWIHDPSAAQPGIELEPVPYHVTWMAMEELERKGLARYIGVCNLNVQGLQDVLSYAHIPPICNQIELHPYLVQQPLVDYCHANQVNVVAFSPLGSSSYQELNMDGGFGVGVLNEPLVLSIARKYHRTPAQIVLRWNLDRGVGVIPKSSVPERNIENFNIFGFELTHEEVQFISSLDKKHRFNDPGVFGKFMGLPMPIFD